MVFDLMTPAEVAALLRVPVSWVYSHTSGDGEKLPFVKCGRLLRFHRAAIETWWSEQQQKSGSKPSGYGTEGERQGITVQ